MNNECNTSSVTNTASNNNNNNNNNNNSSGELHQTMLQQSTPFTNHHKDILDQ
ncbi:unnamed protein product [Schistosoma margrebowiei]|uniref:Uncharacterized protein n=1 Tax=Schistosoma margrebowiei TaxID=48269 RepID=A0A183MJU9_9TREM|nr:unnamed protein product [Schistosoma margrebowiei]